MKVYEIINPSDMMTIEAEELKVAVISILHVSNGAYGLENVDDEKDEFPIFLLGGWREWWKEKYKDDPDEYADKHEKEIIDCLNSVMLGDANDRKLYKTGIDLMKDEESKETFKKQWHETKCSSMNDIAGACWQTAKLLKEKTNEKV